jgi:hypothetical protein|nr:MAG TPA: hypothetical protein [Caudoviricetes sp.]
MTTIFQIKEDLANTGDKLTQCSGVMSNVIQGCDSANIYQMSGLMSAIMQAQSVLADVDQQLQKTANDCENGLEILLSEYILEVKILDVETKAINEQLGFLMSDVQTLQQAFALTGNEDYAYSVKDLHEFSTGFNKYKQQVDKIQTLSVYWDSQLIIKER